MGPGQLVLSQVRFVGLLLLCYHMVVRWTHTNKRIQMHLGSVLFLDLLDLYLLDLYLTGPAICLDLPGSAWICSI